VRIRSFQVWNFRSLASVTVGSLTDLVVFHGDNNTGKSNLLAALNFIFQSKVVEEELPVGVEKPPPARTTPFYYGKLKGFGDNFRWGCDDPIRFEVRLEADDAELAAIRDVDRVAARVPAGKGHSNWITLSGVIERSEDDGDMRLEKARLNKGTFYEADPTGGREFFAGLDSEFSPEERQQAAESLLLYMTDLFMVVGSDRFLTTEPPEGDDRLTSLTFKRWLHKLSLSRDDFPVYQRIRDAFNGPPFNFGEIGFSADTGELEIMILDSNRQRLPIGRLGTGVQQVLMLLAQILQSRSQIIGIEELELNLSYRNQDLVLNKLISLVREADFPLSQLLLTTHSDHLGSRDDVKRYRVALDDTSTEVHRFTRSDRQELFPRSRGRRPVPYL